MDSHFFEAMQVWSVSCHVDDNPFAFGGKKFDWNGDCGGTDHAMDSEAIALPHGSTLNLTLIETEFQQDLLGRMGARLKKGFFRSIPCENYFCEGRNRLGHGGFQTFGNAGNSWIL